MRHSRRLLAVFKVGMFNETGLMLLLLFSSIQASGSHVSCSWRLESGCVPGIWQSWSAPRVFSSFHSKIRCLLMSLFLWELFWVGSLPHQSVQENNWNYPPPITNLTCCYLMQWGPHSPMKWSNVTLSCITLTEENGARKMVFFSERRDKHGRVSRRLCTLTCTVLEEFPEIT